VQATYIIGEQMIASLAAGTDVILNFLWPEAMVPPETVGGTSWHPCLLAEASPHTGPTPSGNLVIDNTNLAQRNVTVDYSDDDGEPHEMTGVSLLRRARSNPQMSRKPSTSAIPL